MGPAHCGGACRRRVWAPRATAAVLIAALASVWWEFSIQPRPHPTSSSVVDALGPSLAALPTIGREVVGVFGALDVLIPEPGYVLWLLLVLALLAAALWVGTPRDRVAILALTAGAVVVVVVMSVVYRGSARFTGATQCRCWCWSPSGPERWCTGVAPRIRGRWHGSWRAPSPSRPRCTFSAGWPTGAATRSARTAAGCSSAIPAGLPARLGPLAGLATLATVAYLAAGLLAAAGTRSAERDPAASMAP